MFYDFCNTFPRLVLLIEGLEVGRPVNRSSESALSSEALTSGLFNVQ